MNDIERLEKLVKNCKEETECKELEQCHDCYIEIEDIQAIENLLKERQADKERIKELEKIIDEINEINFPTIN